MAEHKGHVIGSLVGKANNINGQTHVHSLFLADHRRMSCAVGKADGLKPEAERAAEGMDAVTSELKELRLPEVVQKRLSSVADGKPV